MAFLDRPILAVDFDGTIRKAKRYADKGTQLMPNCKKVIENLFYDGCRLIVWTTRNEDSLDFVKAVLKKHDILQYFEQINENIKEIQWWNTRKIYADYYIDDLNVGGFPGWLKVWEIVMQDEYFTRRQV